MTTAERSSEPPQPSLLEKKMNMTIGWSGANDVRVTGEAPLPAEHRPAGLRAGLGVVPILDVGLA